MRPTTQRLLIAATQVLALAVWFSVSAVVPSLRHDLSFSDAAAVWLTRSRLVWDNRAFPATQRWRLDYAGLAALG